MREAADTHVEGRGAGGDSGSYLVEHLQHGGEEGAARPGQPAGVFPGDGVPDHAVPRAVSAAGGGQPVRLLGGDHGGDGVGGGRVVLRVLGPGAGAPRGHEAGHQRPATLLRGGNE